MKKKINKPKSFVVNVFTIEKYDGQVLLFLNGELMYKSWKHPIKRQPSIIKDRWGTRSII